MRCLLKFLVIVRSFFCVYIKKKSIRKNALMPVCRYKSFTHIRSWLIISCLIQIGYIHVFFSFFASLFHSYFSWHISRFLIILLTIIIIMEFYVAA